MARTTATVNFQVHYQIHFRSIIRSYHVYQSDWSSVAGEKLFVKRDSLSEATAYNKFSVGIY